MPEILSEAPGRVPHPCILGSIFGKISRFVGDRWKAGQHPCSFVVDMTGDIGGSKPAAFKARTPRPQTIIRKLRLPALMEIEVQSKDNSVNCNLQQALQMLLGQLMMEILHGLVHQNPRNLVYCRSCSTTIPPRRIDDIKPCNVKPGSAARRRCGSYQTQCAPRASTGPWLRKMLQIT